MPTNTRCHVHTMERPLQIPRARKACVTIHYNESASCSIICSGTSSSSPRKRQCSKGDCSRSRGKQGSGKRRRQLGSSHLGWRMVQGARNRAKGLTLTTIVDGTTASRGRCRHRGSSWATVGMGSRICNRVASGLRCLQRLLQGLRKVYIIEV